MLEGEVESGYDGTYFLLEFLCGFGYGVLGRERFGRGVGHFYVCGCWGAVCDGWWFLVDGLLRGGGRGLGHCEGDLTRAD